MWLFVPKILLTYSGTTKTPLWRPVLLLVETSRKSQTDNLLIISTFFGIKVSVTEHKSLNSSKGIIRDRMLKGKKESEIVDYLKEQGVTECKRFTRKKDHKTVETNTLLLTFNSITVPKSLKIFYCIIPVDVYVPNPLRCFNCQRFGHHETNCPVDIGSVCKNCGTGGHDHLLLIIVDLLFYVHGKHLRSCRDGQLT